MCANYEKVLTKIGQNYYKVLLNFDQLGTNMIQKAWKSPRKLKKCDKIENIFKQIFIQILFNRIPLQQKRFWNNRQICGVDRRALKLLKYLQVR